MPASGTPLKRLGFLTIGTFDPADPAAGHETTLRVIERGEELGFDSAWLRHRHLQYGISSPVAVLAAASQRTTRIELGTAVIPLGWENPLRLAEDLATVDLLSGGRLNPGVSVGPPTHLDQVKDALYPDTAESEDFGLDRAARMHDHGNSGPGGQQRILRLRPGGRASRHAQSPQRHHPRGDRARRPKREQRRDERNLRDGDGHKRCRAASGIRGRHKHPAPLPSSTHGQPAAGSS